MNCRTDMAECDKDDIDIDSNGNLILVPFYHSAEVYYCTNDYYMYITYLASYKSDADILFGSMAPVQESGSSQMAVDGECIH